MIGDVKTKSFIPPPPHEATFRRDNSKVCSSSAVVESMPLNPSVAFNDANQMPLLPVDSIMTAQTALVGWVERTKFYYRPISKKK